MIFEQLTQVVADYDAVWTAFKASEQAARDVAAAVGERIRADRQQLADRRATLEAQSRDQTRPEVVKRLAVGELDRLQGRKFVPTEDETAAFDTAMRDARDALRDLEVVKAKLRDLFTTAAQELATMRSNTLGSGGGDPELARRHLDGVQRAFDRLSKEAVE